MENLQISLEELISCRFFSKSKVLAGKNGLKNIAVHISTLDAPDAYTYFKGGEFVITTGYSFLHDEDYQKQLVKRLVDKNVTGIGIKLRYFNNKLPECIKEEADRLDFPVISLPNEYAYTDIYEFITSNLVSQIDREIKTFNEVYKEIYHSMHNEGFLGVAKSLYKWTGLQTLISINSKIYLYPEDSLLEYFPMDQSFWRKRMFQNSINSNINCFSWENEDKSLVWIHSEIVQNSHTEGYILLFKKHNHEYVTKETCTLLDYTNLLCSSELRRIETIADTQRKYRNEFLCKFVSKSISLDELKKQAEILDYYLMNEGFVLLIKGMEEKYLNKIIGRIYNEHTLCGMLEDDLAIVYVGSSKNYKDDINTLYKECTLNNNLKNIVIGVGTVADISKMLQSYNEAKCALNIGSHLQNNPNIYFYSELGFYRLLDISSISEEMASYCCNCLKPLESQGKDNYNSLLTTIQCFIKNSYNYKETADELYVHPNTVRYRIATVEKLCNIDFKSFNDRLNMEIALKILPLVDN